MTVAYECKFSEDTKTGRKLQFVIMVDLSSTQVQFLGYSDHASGLLNIAGAFDACDSEDFCKAAQTAAAYGELVRQKLRAQASKDLEESAREYAHITAELDAPLKPTFVCGRCGGIYSLHATTQTDAGYYICTGCCDE